MSEKVKVIRIYELGYTVNIPKKKLGLTRSYDVHIRKDS